MKLFSAALLALATIQVALGYPSCGCHQQQAPILTRQPVPVPIHVAPPQIPYQQPVQHHMPVYVVEDPAHEVLLLEEPARELVVIDTNDEPTALERILRILRKTGCAVRRVGDILAQDAGDELGLDDYGYGSAQAVAHTVINLGHPYIPNGQDDIVVVEPPCEEAVVVQTPQQVVPVQTTPVVQQPVSVVQQPCNSQLHFVSQVQPQPVHQKLPLNTVPVNHHVQVAQPVQHLQPVQPVQHIQPVQPVQQVHPVHMQHVQPVFVEPERYPCEEDIVYRQALPVQTKYTYASKY